MMEWPDPNPRTGQSFAEDSPVGDRWQTRLKKLLYPIVLPIRTRFLRNLSTTMGH